MVKKYKLFKKLIAGSKNIAFSDMQLVVEAFGFRLARVSGSHHIYQHPTLDEQLNLQNKNGKAKPYQVRQFLSLVEKYNLTMGDEAE